MAIDETVHQHKYLLEESEMPTAWYNIVPDLPEPPPPALHPGTLEPAGPDDFAPLFPMDLILQEVSQDRHIDIPGAVLDVYRQWRPSPLFRAHRLERALDTPARIYYKYEGVSPAGSHKPNTAVPQAYYNKRGTVGIVAGHGVRLLRPRVQGLHGACELRPEALSPRHDGSVGSVGHSQSEPRDC